MLQELRNQFRIIIQTQADPQCADCAFFNEHGVNDKQIGTCHAALPAMTTEGRIAWPLVRPTDWCVAYMSKD